MVIREVLEAEKDKFNAAVHHPLQSWPWGEFKKTTGVEVTRLAAFEGQNITRGFQITIHSVPQLNYKIGYFARGDFPDDAQIFALKTIADKENLVFTKLEPNIYSPAGNPSEQLSKAKGYLKDLGCELGRPMFTPYSFLVGIDKAEPDLFAGLKSKTRYNIKLAQKKGVTVALDNSPEAFETYIKLWKQTTKRQGFYAHDETYQRNMWQVMREAGIAHLLKADYQGETLAAWVVFIFNHTLYYPYGASSRAHREVMANNLLAWEAIKFGKSQGCTLFDMWGSLGPDASQSDSWFGFHRFKQGYGGTLMEFAGSYDFIHKPRKYKIFRTLDTWRWRALRLRSKLPF